MYIVAGWPTGSAAGVRCRSITTLCVLSGRSDAAVDLHVIDCLVALCNWQLQRALLLQQCSVQVHRRTILQWNAPVEFVLAQAVSGSEAPLDFDVLSNRVCYVPPAEGAWGRVNHVIQSCHFYMLCMSSLRISRAGIVLCHSTSPVVFAAMQSLLVAANNCTVVLHMCSSTQQCLLVARPPNCV